MKMKRYKKIDLYSGDISNIVKKEKPEELLDMLIDAVDKDVRYYFWVSVENFSRFEEINDVKDWLDAYWDNLNLHLSESIKKFLNDNDNGIDDLMIHAKKIFKELIEEVEEMFPDKKEENMTNIQFIPAYNSSDAETAIRIAFERHPQMQEALIKYSEFHTPQGVWDLEDIRARELGNSSPNHFEEYHFEMGDVKFSMEANCLSPSVLGRDKFIITIESDEIKTIITPWCFHSSNRA